jgi:hypothetical protein
MTPLAAIAARHNGVAVDLFKCAQVFANIRTSFQMSAHLFNVHLPAG